MRTIESRSFGAGATLVLLLLAAPLLFAASAQAQTPAEDQYGSPTGSPTGSPADPPVADATEGSASGGAEGGTPQDAASASAGDPSGQDEGVSGGVLPATGGASIYAGLAGLILVGTSVTLLLRHRTGTR